MGHVVPMPVDQEGEGVLTALAEGEKQVSTADPGPSTADRAAEHNEAGSKKRAAPKSKSKSSSD